MKYEENKLDANNRGGKTTVVFGHIYTRGLIVHSKRL